jgi:hypothetical protein
MHSETNRKTREAKGNLEMERAVARKMFSIVLSLERTAFASFEKFKVSNKAINFSQMFE